MTNPRLWFPLFLAIFTSLASLSAFAQEGRSKQGLLALYDFAAEEGDVVHDRSGVGEPLNLRIASTKGVDRRSGSLKIRQSSLIRSEGSAAKIGKAFREAGEFTLEIWFQPANTSQSGPARIVTISKNSSERNFTFGQDGDHYDVRLRTTKTSTNGIPSLAAPGKSVETRLTHAVYAFAKSGETRLFINGKQVARKNTPGDPSNWNDSFQLALGNELSSDRPWLGEFRLVAIFNRALSADEVAAHFRYGPTARLTPEQLAAAKQQANETLFRNRVAGILANQCFECHDSTTRRGELDLSRRDLAFKGGESGEVLSAGKPADSSLFTQVESGDMPKDRDPLSDEEKAVLKKWIEAGAHWPIERIDPAIYAHDTRAGDVWVQRLTRSEYVETIRSTFGVNIEAEAQELLPPDLRADGFSNTAYNLGVDLKHVEAYSRLAKIVVDRIDAVKFAARFSRSQKFTDKDMNALIESMGKRVLRGPLSADEVTTLRGISTAVASTGGNFEEAVEYILQAMLQSPRFIYRIEQQGGAGRVTDYELASRMSYIVWGGPPDDELFKLADEGKLSDRGVFQSQVERMLKDDRAIDRSAQFLAEWLNLNRLKNLNPDTERFSGWNEKLADDMRKETLAFFVEVCWKQNRPLSDLLNAQVTYATPELAKHYGLKPAGDKLARYDLADVSHRGGLLTQGSVLTIGGDEASMVARGLFVLHDLLRGTVKDPPPCVDTTPVASKPGVSQRSVAESRIANQACGGCHVKFEPLAFGLEKYNGLGQFHEIDKFENKLREDGEILFPGDAKPVSYKTSAELMDLLADSDRVKRTLTWKATQFALGRPLTAADAEIVDQIHTQSQSNGGTWKALITAILQSKLVQNRK